MSRDRRRTICDGAIALAAFPLTIGMSGVNNLHSFIFGMCVGWIAVPHVVAAIREVIAWRDERRFLRKCAELQEGRTLTDEQVAAAKRLFRGDDR